MLRLAPSCGNPLASQATLAHSAGRAAVAVAFAVGDPARRATIGHRHRHRVAAGRLHVPERGLGSNGVDACQQAVGVDGGVLAQYQRTGA